MPSGGAGSRGARAISFTSVFLPDYSITGHVIPDAGSYMLMVNYGLGDASLLARA